MPPGYTGHLPYRNDTVGMTTGEAHKSCLEQYELNNSTNLTSKFMLANAMVPKTSRNTGLRSDSQGAYNTLDAQKLYMQQKMKLVGNQSRNAASWLGGPKHEIRD